MVMPSDFARVSQVGLNFCMISRPSRAFGTDSISAVLMRFGFGLVCDAEIEVEFPLLEQAMTEEATAVNKKTRCCFTWRLPVK
jgi:hypothetical protein